MNIAPIEITVADIFASFEDNQETGVVAYDGNLNVRPPYQREFIYDDTKQEAVIHTIRKGFPLNVMYWAKNPDGTYELLDGQQRTLSFCKFFDGGFSVDMTGNGNVRYFHNLLPDEQQKSLNYMMDDDVTKMSGAYEYVMTGNERALHIRAFTPGQKRGAYERQQGVCPFCAAEGNNKRWEFKEMEADHMTPWSQGGYTTVENCQMLCKTHNRKKSGGVATDVFG